jgi:hypothetical protein
LKKKKKRRKKRKIKKRRKKRQKLKFQKAQFFIPSKQNLLRLIGKYGKPIEIRLKNLFEAQWRNKEL